MDSTVYLSLVVRPRVVYLYALPSAQCNASDLMVSQQGETLFYLVAVVVYLLWKMPPQHIRDSVSNKLI